MAYSPMRVFPEPVGAQITTDLSAARARSPYVEIRLAQREIILADSTQN